MVCRNKEPPETCWGLPETIEHHHNTFFFMRVGFSTRVWWGFQVPFFSLLRWQPTVESPKHQLQHEGPNLSVLNRKSVLKPGSLRKIRKKNTRKTSKRCRSVGLRFVPRPNCFASPLFQKTCVVFCAI